MNHALAFAAVALVLVSTSSASGIDRPVQIASASGVVLAGRSFDPGIPGPGALFFHMCRPDAIGAWSGVAERLAAAGVHALTVNYQGWGGSTGRAFTSPRSLDDARAYWKDNWTVDADRSLEQLFAQMGRRGPVAVIGSSCGVFMSLLTASRHAEKVRGRGARRPTRFGARRVSETNTRSSSVCCGECQGRSCAGLGTGAEGGHNASRLEVAAARRAGPRH
jgi:predicted alpha/beta hydrolase